MENPYALLRAATRPAQSGPKRANEAKKNLLANSLLLFLWRASSWPPLLHAARFGAELRPCYSAGGGAGHDALTAPSRRARQRVRDAVQVEGRPAAATSPRRGRGRRARPRRHSATTPGRRAMRLASWKKCPLEAAGSTGRLTGTGPRQDAPRAANSGGAFKREARVCRAKRPASRGASRAARLRGCTRAAAAPRPSRTTAAGRTGPASSHAARGAYTVHSRGPARRRSGRASRLSQSKSSAVKLHHCGALRRHKSVYTYGTSAARRSPYARRLYGPHAARPHATLRKKVAGGGESNPRRELDRGAWVTISANQSEVGSGRRVVRPSPGTAQALPRHCTPGPHITFYKMAPLRRARERLGGTEEDHTGRQAGRTVQRARRAGVPGSRGFCARSGNAGLSQTRWGVRHASPTPPFRRTTKTSSTVRLTLSAQKIHDSCIQAWPLSSRKLRRKMSKCQRTCERKKTTTHK